LTDVLKTFEKKAVDKEYFARTVFGQAPFGKALENYCNSLVLAGENSPLTTALNKFSDVQKKISQSKTTLNNEIKDTFLNPFEHFLQNDAKKVIRAKERYNKAKKAYESDLSRITDVENGKVTDLSKIYSTTIDFSTSSTDFHITQNHLIDTLDAANLRGKVDIIVALKSAVTAQMKFFSECFDQLKDLEKTVSELESVAETVFFFLSFSFSFFFFFYIYIESRRVHKFDECKEEIDRRNRRTF
jgi:hypothetical protein